MAERRHLLDDRSHPLGGEVDGVQRLLHAQALDSVEDELRLLRAGALELRLGAELSNFFYCIFAMTSFSFKLPNSKMPKKLL